MDHARAVSHAASRGSTAFGTAAVTASLALAGWSLQRTVSHDAELAKLAEGRDVAVVRAQLEAVNARLARVEASLDRIAQTLDQDKNR